MATEFPVFNAIFFCWVISAESTSNGIIKVKSSETSVIVLSINRFNEFPYWFITNSILNFFSCPLNAIGIILDWFPIATTYSPSSIVCVYVGLSSASNPFQYLWITPFTNDSFALFTQILLK